MSWKKTLLETWKIFRLFVNTLSADDKYSLLNRDSLTQQIQIQLSQKKIFFFSNFPLMTFFFFAFVKSILNFQHFKKNMTPIADVFPKLWTPNDVVR